MMRCPAVQDLPDDVYHILHHSFVEILKMCRSIAIAEARIDESMMAVIESCDVLKRVRDDRLRSCGAGCGRRRRADPVRQGSAS